MRFSPATACVRDLVLCLIVLALCPFAQMSAQFRGGLQGTVTDSTGAVVPGAKVTLTSNDTNIARQATTNENGVYSVPSLAPGRYSIKVEKLGFRNRLLNDVL